MMAAERGFLPDRKVVSEPGGCDYCGRSMSFFDVTG
jgi:hypothetical protein